PFRATRRSSGSSAPATRTVRRPRKPACCARSASRRPSSASFSGSLGRLGPAALAAFAVFSPNYQRPNSALPQKSSIPDLIVSLLCAVSIRCFPLFPCFWLINLSALNLLERFPITLRRAHPPPRPSPTKG